MTKYKILYYTRENGERMMRELRTDNLNDAEGLDIYRIRNNYTGRACSLLSEAKGGKID